MGKILTVDDDPHVLRSMGRLLRHGGHEVSAATTPADALRLAGTNVFDVAVVDYDLGSMSGLDLLMHLCELQPRCLRVLASGQLDMQVVLDAVNRGRVSRVLEKPLTCDSLNHAIEECLQSQRKIEAMCVDAQAAVAESDRRMLEECLADDMLRLAVQPIVTADASKPVAYEALLRSSHAGLTTPLAVLRAAESLGMLASIGAVVTRCADGWMQVLPSDVKLFMNLHPAEFSEPDSLKQRLTPLRRWTHRLVIEITERARITEIEGWQESVAWLRDGGFGLALDDLGAGYSSLSMLAELSPQYVKVDMSIVRHIDGDSRKQRLVDLICRFVETTDASVVAEGVETPGEAEALRGCGVQLLQGYLFGRPSFDVPASASVAESGAPCD